MESRQPLLSPSPQHSPSPSPPPERGGGELSSDQPATSTRVAFFPYEPITRGAASPAGELPRPQLEVEERTDSLVPATPPQLVLPPLSSMDQISGYHNIGFEMTSEAVSAIPPPPSAEQTTRPHSYLDPLSFNIPSISEEEAREALLETVSSHCCYGTRAARELIFTNITSSSAFHYQLETFTEGRKSAWEYEPYTGQVVDGPENGVAPHPWAIPAQPNRLFLEHHKHFEVPHTASVKSCHNCCGEGFTECWDCGGAAKTTCISCHGRGKTRDLQDGHDVGPCSLCSGSGKIDCATCQGRGRVPCQLCLVRGRLKCYIKLTVSWRTHGDEQVIERSSLPDGLIRGAQGVVAMQDQQPRVIPVAGFPEESVNSVSTSLVDRHGTAWPNERILMQRHQVRVVPVAEAFCAWKSRNFNYFVYGQERLIHAPDYPQRCCWGCVIL